MRIQQQNKKKRPLNSAEEWGSASPATRWCWSAWLSARQLLAASAKLCTQYGMWKTGDRYWDRSLETGNIVVHFTVWRELKKENATKPQVCDSLTPCILFALFLTCASLMITVLGLFPLTLTAMRAFACVKWPRCFSSTHCLPTLLSNSWD